MLGNRRQARELIRLVVSALLASGLLILAPPPPLSAQSVDFPLRTLLIIDSAVISDPTRTTDPCAASPSLQKWGFGALMKEMAAAASDAGGIAFIQNWLGKFRAVQPVNGEQVLGRDIDKIWNGWESQGWDLKRVPLRLLAIVNRIDLLRSPLLAGENAGEMRFVFGAVDLSDLRTCTPLNFTVILEYGVRKSSCVELRAWAEKWAELAVSPPGSNDYNKILWPLTDSVTARNPDRAKPNGSAIDHVRTNEKIMADEWELREFKLNPKTGQLTQDTVTMTPKDSLNGASDLTAFLRSIEPGINATPPDYWIPERFPAPTNAQLLGGMAVAGTAWQTHPFNFAVNTCSGCHGGRIGDRTHIAPDGTPSPFLIGELSARKDVLNALKADGCSAILFDSEKPMRLVH